MSWPMLCMAYSMQEQIELPCGCYQSDSGGAFIRCDHHSKKTNHGNNRQRRKDSQVRDPNKAPQRPPQPEPQITDWE